ncbi:EipB family protein [Aestuariivirga sp.]|uniref:EipB family protein n=1 Tax=Aestuariivirga sp. TaxID=2650926 RepID=UPI0039E6F685
MKRLTLALLFTVVGWQAEAASIAAHRAIYDIKMLNATDKAHLSAVDGRLAFEIQGSACDGWTTNFRMATRYSPSDGDAKTIDTQSTSFETPDGLEMQFNQKEYTNNQLGDETRIKASRPDLNSPISGTSGKDTPKPFTVDAGALFPMQHQAHLMDMAAKGESRDSSVIFDGSDDANAFRVITFIGKKKEPGQNAKDNDNPNAKPLSAFASWPMSLSYFPLKNDGDDSDQPTYQISFDMYANGVASNLVLNYGDFTLGGQLANLEIYKPTTCP